MLAARVGTAERAVVEVAEPPRPGRYETRVRALVVRWGDLRPREPVLLELPPGRAPPQGATLSLLGQLRQPRGPSHGFDERSWLRRHGVHVVLRAETWRVVGRRGGLGAVADRVHAWLARDGAPGLGGERKAVLEGVVLGEDQGLSDTLKQRFRASGLYHLLAVSGSNVACVAGGALGLLLLLGVSRLWAEVGALAAIGAYVLAVGPQPSVLRAGVGGALVSLAWLTGRQRDAWHALLLAAVVLLAWNPYLVLDAGFQLSFAAVLSIFLVAPRLRRVLDGYPLPQRLRTGVAVSAACSLGTAPVSWFQFHQVSLVAVPANAAAAPAVVPMLGLALRLGRDRPGRAAARARARRAERLVRRLSRRLRAVLRRPARRPGALPGRRRRARRRAAPGGRLCLAAWRTSSSRSISSPAATVRRSRARCTGCGSASAMTRPSTSTRARRRARTRRPRATRSGSSSARGGS